MHSLVLLETRQRVVGTATVIITTHINSFRGVVHFLVVLQVIFATKCSIASITSKCFGLGVDEKMSLEFEL